MQRTFPIKEGLPATLLAEPSSASLQEFLENNPSESDNVEFKRDFSPSPKLAKHLLAIGNHGGGCIVFGIEDKSMRPLGLRDCVDEAVFTKKVQRFLPDALTQNVKLHTFRYPKSAGGNVAGKQFQMIIVKDDPTLLPYVSQSESADEIRRGAIYIRRGTCSEEANYEELQAVLNRRIETGYSSRHQLELKGQLEELRLLHHELSYPVAYHQFPFAGRFHTERAAEFLWRMIDLKKSTIQRLVEGISE
jgi:predicted HTH transcriptional regulator